ncbi:M48 family metallopeptidase [Bifidobacterium sp.]|uniref:M48 family metallopeptidase n=1 Tax=Bifidobacterium sp. TaxID=41200 RepID=UPI0025BF2C90|nr:SprT-like domain-containing protein [Bifidobacterium sp.]MCI1634851.1 M48 family metallopeptidase [Bifidobacterium sp.]
MLMRSLSVELTGIQSLRENIGMSRITHPTGPRSTRRSQVKLSLLQWHDETIHIKRGRVKNLYLRVKPPDGHIEVTAPLKVKDEIILEFIESREPWIDRSRNRLSAALSSGVPQGKSSWDQESIIHAKSIMNQQLPLLLQHWVPIVGREPSSISLRLMTSRWGSCTPATRRIRLNLELARLDPKFLEYVLVHELTHLHVHGHGPEFQRHMNMYLPEWKMLRKELNTHMIV